MSPLPIVLASSSVTRQKQLKQLNIPFSSCAPNIDETPLDNETAGQLVTRLAAEKAQAVASKFPHHYIIGGDQVLCIGKTILGKPKNEANALQHLRTCSGKTAIFYTGLALLNTKTSTLHIELMTTQTEFRTLSEREIEHYIQLDQPLGCAGSIQIESRGLLLTKRVIADDPFSVLGIPVLALRALFEREGVNLLCDFIRE